MALGFSVYVPLLFCLHEDIRSKSVRIGMKKVTRLLLILADRHPPFFKV